MSPIDSALSLAGLFTSATLTDVQVEKLLKVCEGRDFDARRDMAILRVLLDTGLRRSELAGLRVKDLDLDARTIHVEKKAKGSRPRTVAIGRKATSVLDQYIRIRARHRHASREALWLGRTGPLSHDGVHVMLLRRAKQAGLTGVHAHLFRHLFASDWLRAGGQEGDLLQLAGWRSRVMLNRYGAAAAAERAREAHERFSPGDRR